MIKRIKPLTAAVAVAAALMMAPGLSSAETNQYCYDHPSDHSNYCYCYRHPKQCNNRYRENHPDWNQPPWEAHHHHHHPNESNYHQGQPPYGEGQYHGPPPNGGYPPGPPPNSYNQQYH
jgi:hypothetical protein